MKRPALYPLILASLVLSIPTRALDLNPLGGQLRDLPRQLDPITQPLKKPLDESVARNQKNSPLVIDSVEKLEQPLASLPQRLPILNTKGKTTFIDVAVEQGWRAVEREWLVTLDDSELAVLKQPNIEILEKVRLRHLAMTLVRFKVSPELDSYAALNTQLPTAIAMRVDRNHIYATQNQAEDESETAIENQNEQNHPNENNTAEKTPLVSSACNLSVNVGMIDSAINLQHPVFNSGGRKPKIYSKNFVAKELHATTAHGTAIASLLIGKHEQLQPLLPKARLYAASVFFDRQDYAQGSTLSHLISALNWMAGQNLKVINMSLAGPDNHLLAVVIQQLIAKGFVIVAAAGNEGPAAPAVFPAAYPGVIAVTAVTHDEKIYRWANRGNYISFAALGVAVMSARADGGLGKNSGTSMAAPVVSAHMACTMAQTKSKPAQALQALIARAKDLGIPGRDNVFGYGLL